MRLIGQISDISHTVKNQQQMAMRHQVFSFSADASVDDEVTDIIGDQCIRIEYNWGGYRCRKTLSPHSNHVAIFATMDKSQVPALLVSPPEYGGNRKVPSTQWALTVHQLSAFFAACIATPEWQEIEEPVGFGSKVGYLNGYDLNDKFAKPWTRGKGSSVALLLNPKVPKEADAMISHTWAQDMQQFLAAILSEIPSKSTSIWICILAIYQPGDNYGPSVAWQVEQRPFYSVIQSALVKTMFVVHIDKAELYDRLWCVHKIDVAIAEGVVIVPALSNQFRGIMERNPERFNMIDVFDGKWKRGKECWLEQYGRVSTGNARCTSDSDERYIKTNLSTWRLWKVRQGHQRFSPYYSRTILHWVASPSIPDGFLGLPNEAPN